MVRNGLGFFRLFIIPFLFGTPWAYGVEHSHFESRGGEYSLGTMLPSRDVPVMEVSVAFDPNAAAAPRKVILGLRETGKANTIYVEYLPDGGQCSVLTGPQWQHLFHGVKNNMSRISLRVDTDGSVFVFLDDQELQTTTFRLDSPIGVFEMTMPFTQKPPSGFVTSIQYRTIDSTDSSSIAASSLTLDNVPATHSYLGWDDLSHVTLWLIYHFPSDHEPLPDWKDRLTLAAAEIQRLHTRLFNGMITLETIVHPDPVRSTYSAREHQEGDFGTGMTRILAEVSSRVEIPEKHFLQVIVFSDSDLREDAGAYACGVGIYYYLGSSWIVAGASTSRSLPSSIPDEPDKQVAHPVGQGSQVHWSWPWTMMFHEMLHGYRLPDRPGPGPSILGPGLYQGIYKVTLPDWCKKGMRGPIGLFEVDESIDSLIVLAQNLEAPDLDFPLLERNLERIPTLYLEAAMRYQEFGLHDRANKYFSFAASTAEGDAYDLYGVANTLYSHSRFEDAMTVLNKILQESPDYPYAHRLLAYIYMHSPKHRDDAKARQCLERAIDRYTTSEEKQSAREELMKLSPPLAPPVGPSPRDE